MPNKLFIESFSILCPSIMSRKFFVMCMCWHICFYKMHEQFVVLCLSCSMSTVCWVVEPCCVIYDIGLWSVPGGVSLATTSPSHSPHLSPSNSPLMMRRTASPIAPLKQTTTPKKSNNTTIQVLNVRVTSLQLLPYTHVMIKIIWCQLFLINVMSIFYCIIILQHIFLICADE